ncbi:phage repressor protein C with HTH and peptisase S24 domain [Rhizomicrobium palustre]|uniref:Phage repressor protein C with HTH and peptisase S24 domain n=1 Tax=Rhizomicrobium palustre TaxID=189966 RepID=A0A846N1J7_9PROT|nr:hypothetical protein [Rhizomicrobium palustre]NIK89473.1 phage repressor protein C with HTH and peptisase S24 domain [Rhizomicrobium palustre]
MDVTATSSPALTAPAARNNVSTKLAEAQAEKLKEQQQALQQLKAMPKASSDNAKAQAKQRVEQVRQMLRQMKMLAAGNPKQMARQIAELAKELAAAVKEYAQTTGGSAAAATDAADMANAATTAKAAELGAPNEKGEAKAEDAKSAEAGKSDASRASDASEQKQAVGAYQKTGSDIQKQLQQSPEAKDKDDFLNEVRGLSRQLKEMAKAAKQAFAGQHQTSRDVQDSMEALTKLDKSVEAASGGSALILPGAALNISA